MKNRQIWLRSRPNGIPQAADFDLREVLDLGGKRAGKPAQGARGAVVLGDVFIRAVTDRKDGLQRTAREPGQGNL
jgi:hypothetical protein